MNDKALLSRAIQLAETSHEPVKCGCVLVKDGTIIAEAFNSQHSDNIATHHAEVKAVEQANRKLGTRTLEGAVAFCSCEPCAMCLSVLSLAKVERIVFSKTMKDVSPDDPMARLDSAAFAAQYLNFVPKLEQLLV